MPPDQPPTRITKEIAALDALGQTVCADDVDPCGPHDAFRRGAWFALLWLAGSYPKAPSEMIREGMAEDRTLKAEGERYVCRRVAFGYYDTEDQR